MDTALLKEVRIIQNQPLIIAHRGASEQAPENTLEAFELAVKMQADGIETDAYLTRDGRIVLCHDIRLERTSNAQGRISEYDLQELKQFDFGYHFYGGRRGIRIPTLEETFGLLKSTDLMLNIEIKDGSSELPGMLLRLAEGFGMASRILYSSFDHLQLERIKRMNPNARIGVLYGMKELPLVHAAQYAALMGADALHPRASLMQLFPNLVEEAHALGLMVNPYTVDSEAEAIDLTARGCDALITNRPDVVRAGINKYSLERERRIT